MELVIQLIFNVKTFLFFDIIINDDINNLIFPPKAKIPCCVFYDSFLDFSKWKEWLFHLNILNLLIPL